MTGVEAEDWLVSSLQVQDARYFGGPGRAGDEVEVGARRGVVPGTEVLGSMEQELKGRR